MNPFLRSVLRAPEGDGTGTGSGGGDGGAAAAAAAPAAAAAAAGGKGAEGKGGEAPAEYKFAKVKTTTKDAAGADVVTESDPPAEITKEVAEFAKANKLSPEHAQALLNRELALIESASKADKDAQAKGLQALKTKWNTEAKADKELGGADGTQFDANLAIGKRALNKFFPEIAADANSHPFLDHPQVLKGLLKIGQLLSPDGAFIAGKGNEPARTAAQNMFPNMR